MTLIPRGYIVDSNNQKKAVILDINDFNRVEEIIEQQGLAKMMDEVENEDAIPLEKAKEFCKFY
jgi:hypothetical protein